MPTVFIQHAFDGIVNRYRGQNAAGHFFPNFPDGQLALNLADVCF